MCLQSDEAQSSTQVERVKAAVSDVRKTATDTERRVDNVTSRMWRLETKHAHTEKQIKENSSKIFEQKATVARRVRELDNVLTKEKTERTDDTAALQKRVLELENKMTTENRELNMRIETELRDLRAKIRQVTSERRVFEDRFATTRQSYAVHVGESQLTVP